ncbi:hypothetical protein P879_03425 [Paragonimus westermani]|uniref:FHA domain-containing protein n=1 Tax=Paragonimus westermani TaxID=34504 RepID=A0A8T0DE69_9TREM|nr:hypothetical protein P879_03425 [Paragonimus westermani]
MIDITLLCTKITGPNLTVYTEKDVTVIGRKSRLPVDVPVDDSSGCVSRKHLEILRKHKQLYLKCFSKNGIFINGDFHMKKSEYVPLLDGSKLRFPSTNTILFVETSERFETPHNPEETPSFRSNFNHIPNLDSNIFQSDTSGSSPRKLVEEQQWKSLQRPLTSTLLHALSESTADQLLLSEDRVDSVPKLSSSADSRNDEMGSRLEGIIEFIYILSTQICFEMLVYSALASHAI